MNGIVLEKLQKEKVKFESLLFLAGDASNRKYFIIEQDKKKNVLMLDEDSTNLRRFIYCTSNLKKYVSVPEILYNLENSNILILENFQNRKYSQLINNSNKKILYKTAVDSLIFIHKKKIQIKLKAYSLENFFNESDLFFDWYLNKMKQEEKVFIKNHFNKIFEKYLNKTFLLPTVFIHRDYHIDNLFFLDKRNNHFQCGWIDYQDALMGPCVYDLMSLTQDARIDVENEMENFLIDYYLSNFSDIDKELFIYSYGVLAIQRHLKVLGIFSRLALRDNKINYLKFIPRVKKLLMFNLTKNEFRPLFIILKPLIEKRND